jgi:hypothetical protein
MGKRIKAWYLDKEGNLKLYSFLDEVIDGFDSDRFADSVTRVGFVKRWESEFIIRKTFIPAHRVLEVCVIEDKECQNQGKENQEQSS